MNLEKFSMSAVLDKLEVIAGHGKFATRDWQVRKRLNWHTKAKSVVRHMLSGERKISVEEAAQIHAAHLKYCAEQVEANRNENTKLFADMHSAIAAMQATDPDFYRPHIEAIGELLFQGRDMVRKNGSEG